MILVLLKTFYPGLKKPHCPLDVSKGHAALAANTTLRHAVNVTVRAAAGWTRYAISCPAMVTRIISVRPREVSCIILLCAGEASCGGLKSGTPYALLTMKYKTG